MASDAGSVVDREQILTQAQAIEDATSAILQVEDRAKRVCEDIKNSLGFDFAAVQLVDLGTEDSYAIERLVGSAARRHARTELRRNSAGPRGSGTLRRYGTTMLLRETVSPSPRINSGA